MAPAGSFARPPLSSGSFPEKMVGIGADWLSASFDSEPLPCGLLPPDGSEPRRFACLYASVLALSSLLLPLIAATVLLSSASSVAIDPDFVTTFLACLMAVWVLPRRPQESRGVAPSERWVSNASPEDPRTPSDAPDECRATPPAEC